MEEKVILIVKRQEQGILVEGSIIQDELAQVIISLLNKVKENTWSCVNRIYQLGRGLAKAMVDSKKEEEKMFRNKNLSVLAMVGTGWSQWLYRDTSLDVADMEKIGFFNQVKSIMNTGDLIILVGKDTVKQKYVFIHQGEIILEELGK